MLANRLELVQLRGRVLMVRGRRIRPLARTQCDDAATFVDRCNVSLELAIALFPVLAEADGSPPSPNLDCPGDVTTSPVLAHPLESLLGYELVETRKHASAEILLSFLSRMEAAFVARDETKPEAKERVGDRVVDLLAAPEARQLD